MGLGIGLTFLPSLSVVGHHFRRRRALAVGIVISGASAGGIVFPIMLNRCAISLCALCRTDQHVRLLEDRTVGFANAVRASGAVVGACLLLANGLMRTRPPGIPQGGKPRLTAGAWRGVVWDGAYLWSICG